MKVRAMITLDLDDDAVAAFCRYHRLNPAKPRAVADVIRTTVSQLGTMGLDEQLHAGREDKAEL